MKKAIAILFFLLLQVNYCALAEEKIEADINLSSVYETCLKDIDVEKELENYLNIKPIYINLKECIEIALLYNFSLKGAKFDYDKAKWIYKNSLTNFLPDIQSRSYIMEYQGQVLVGGALVDKFHETALSFNVYATHYLTNGGQQIFEMLAKKNLKFASRHELNFTEAEVLLHTSQYYYDLLKKKINIEIYQKNYKERCAQLTLTQNLKNAGLGTKFDVIRAQTELAQAQQTLLDSMQEFRYAEARLANVLGVEVTTPLMPIEVWADEYTLVDETKDIEDLYKLALSTREDVQEINYEIKALKQQKREIYTEFIPKPRVMAQQQWQGTADVGVGPATIVGGYLDISLGSNMGLGTVTKAKAKQAEINKRINDLEQKLRGIKEDIVKSYWESRVSKDRIAISRKQVLYATESVKLAELRQDAGEGILIDVIQAQTFKTRTRIELINSIIRYNTAQIQMLFDSGIIDKEKILNKYSP